MFDLFAITVHAGSILGEYDLNEDGHVDWKDLGVALGQLGRHCRRG